MAVRADVDSLLWPRRPKLKRAAARRASDRRRFHLRMYRILQWNDSFVLVWRRLRDGGGSRAAPTVHNDKRFRAKDYSNLPRARATEERPEGLVYRAALITEGEERDMLGFLERVEFHEIVMRGQTARRTVHHYGWDYDYSEYGRITAGDPLPDELAWVRERAAELAELDPAALEQALVSRYPAGAGIGWHRDAPMFGSKVIGISLA